jgi:hypothetical protein
VATTIGADPKPMLACWQTRRTLRNIAAPLTAPIVEQYMTFVQALLQYLDRLPGNAPGRSEAGLDGGSPRSQQPVTNT